MPIHGWISCRGRGDVSFRFRGVSHLRGSFPRENLQKVFNRATDLAFPSDTVSIQRSSLGKADYQLSTFLLARKHNLPPKQVAEQIIELVTKEKIVGSANFSAPGFVNVNLSNDWIADWIFKFATTKRKEPNDPIDILASTENPMRVLVDFASPNMCKELHVGHLRSTVLGNCLANVLEYMGHEVTRINHAGDFGTPIGIVLAQAFEEGAAFLKDGTLPTPTELSSLYVRAKKRFGKDADFTKKAYEYTTELQKKEKASQQVFQAWSALCEASRQGFNHTFARLDVTVKEQGESFYASFIPSLIQELTEKEMLVAHEGAKGIIVKEDTKPIIVEKSDGSHLYTTTDLAAIRYRLSKGLQRLIYVTDESQKVHFQHIFAVGSLSKITVFSDSREGRLVRSFESAVESRNIRFDNKKLSSREASTLSLSLSELLDKSLVETAAVVNAQRESHGLGPIDNPAIIEALAYGAIKYFDLSHRADYVFSFKRMLALKGNTALYLLYAIVRIRSIRRKSNLNTSQFTTPPTITHENERALAVALLQFFDIIAEVESNLTPHSLCDYLFDLGHKFNSFYESCPIVGQPEENSRFQMCLVVEGVMLKGLHLLGLKPVEYI